MEQRVKPGRLGEWSTLSYMFMIIFPDTYLQDFYRSLNIYSTVLAFEMKGTIIVHMKTYNHIFVSAIFPFL